MIRTFLSTTRLVTSDPTQSLSLRCFKVINKNSKKFLTQSKPMAVCHNFLTDNVFRMEPTFFFYSELFAFPLQIKPLNTTHRAWPLMQTILSNYPSQISTIIWTTSSDFELNNITRFGLVSAILNCFIVFIRSRKYFLKYDQLKCLQRYFPTFPFIILARKETKCHIYSATTFFINRIFPGNELKVNTVRLKNV